MNQLLVLGLVVVVILMMNKKGNLLQDFSKILSSKSKKSDCNMIILVFVGFLVFVMMNKKSVVEGFDAGDDCGTLSDEKICNSARDCEWTSQGCECNADTNPCSSSCGPNLQCFMSGIENIQGKCGGTWEELDLLHCSPPPNTKDDCLNGLRDFKGIYAGMFNETEHLADIITSCTRGDSDTPSDRPSDRPSDDSGGDRPSDDSGGVNQEGFRNRRKRH